MADKGGDRLSGNKGQEPGQDRPRPFINEKIVRAVTDMGFEETTPIQAKAIPVVMEGPC